MYRLAGQYAGDLAGYGVQQLSLDELFNMVKSIPYIPDDRLCSSPECLQRPALALSGGDCDDKTIVSGAAFNLRGTPWRIRTVSFSPSGEMQHTYPEIFVDGSWRPFDATYDYNELYRTPAPLASLTWSNPNMKTEQFGNAYSVQSLEGGLGLAPALLIETASILSKINSILEQIPLIGSLFRGSTTHVDFDTAVAKQREMGNQAVALYNSLDAQGKTLYYDLARTFFEGHILNGFGTSWDNLIGSDYLTWQAKGFLKDPATSVYHWISMPVFYFLRLEDATRVESSLEAWYTQPVNRLVYEPISQYLAVKYNVSLDEVREAGGITQATTAGASTSGTLGLLALAGLAILMVPGRRSAPGRRRRSRKGR